MMMDLFTIFYLQVSIAIPNLIIYYLFKKIIIKKSNSGMKFLLFNLVKDFVWISFWIYKLDKDLEIFFYIISVFLINSFLLYYVVIKKLNSI